MKSTICVDFRCEVNRREVEDLREMIETGLGLGVAIERKESRVVFLSMISNSFSKLFMLMANLMCLSSLYSRFLLFYFINKTVYLFMISFQ